MEFVQAAAAFVVAIGVLVTVHEFGHFWVARRLGVKVLRFSVGFGRPLLTRRGRDGTEFVVAAMPLGGYVKMLDEREGAVDPALAARAFNRQSLSVRTAIVVAGPAANFLFAIFAYWLMFMLGVNGLKAMVGGVSPESIAQRAGLRAGHEVVAVDGRAALTWEAVVQAVIGRSLDGGPIRLDTRDSDGRAGLATLDLSGLVLDDLAQGKFFDAIGVEPARPAIPPIIGRVVAGEEAQRAGLREGDEVLRADGQPIGTWGAWVRFVRAHPERPIDLEIRRGGETVRVALRPAARTDEASGEIIGRIGAGAHQGASQEIERFYVTERHGPWDALIEAVHKTYDISALTLGVFWKMLRLEVSVKNLSGPISIAQYAGHSAENGAARFLQFLAIVSVSLGILNLLPIPVLDGGHLLYNLLEAVKGGPLSEQSQIVGQQLGIALLVGLMGLAFYNDLARLLG